MCGRFSITGDLDFYAEYFGVDNVITESLGKSWNVAPTDPVYVVGEKDGERQLGTMNWGLVPHWAANTKTIHINARAETVDTNAAFRDSFATKRCLIPADGFYEWAKEGSRKVPYWIHSPDREPMGFAGIWERSHLRVREPVFSMAIITVDANDRIQHLHDRMPAIVPAADRKAWLDTETLIVKALSLLKPYEGALEAYPVSTVVNSPANDEPGCIEPV